ncbi:acyl-CoA-binding domain-containing protein 4 [Dorcoceras hygrometricum]|uniref:Acyl-CoA-binding domain-containing protein 4 n=1 Tax=Dorcoceras hygrometricum TaxID=472368 RepID=A0A2Z7C7S1_9LAMI|nr:acyl-CoA-binding domain-containing protein 4 [Dorcoceras hygrometricum]
MIQLRAKISTEEISLEKVTAQEIKLGRTSSEQEQLRRTPAQSKFSLEKTSTQSYRSSLKQEQLRGSFIANQLRDDQLKGDQLRRRRSKIKLNIISEQELAGTAKSRKTQIRTAQDRSA